MYFTLVLRFPMVSDNKCTGRNTEGGGFVRVSNYYPEIRLKGHCNITNNFDKVIYSPPGNVTYSNVIGCCQCVL